MIFENKKRLIPVFYRPEMVADTESFSPSAGKPAAVVADWKAHDLPIAVTSFTPVSSQVLSLAHEESYVAGVLTGGIANGFGNHSAAVAASLPYTVGSMIAAAKYVTRFMAEHSVATVACSPTSGFHHAGFRHGGGYCTLNGLVITAMHLKALGLVNTVGILDWDFHYGDGTAEIIAHLGLDWIKHVTHSGTGESDSLKRSVNRDPRRDLQIRVPNGMFQSGRVDLVLYQAGADVHEDDPLGGYMNSAEMRDRDERVFWYAKRCDTPLVWNLAGGYQRDAAGTIEPVLALHRATMEACAKEYTT